MMNMPRRGRNYKRFPCELEPETIALLKERADAIPTTYAAFTRALIAHSLSCPIFLAETSNPGTIQGNEGSGNE
jgi:hypothetical protein